MAGSLGSLLLLWLILLLSLVLGYAGKALDNVDMIMDGIPCARGSHPWLVALFEKNTFECAGVLIDEQWVLTVAHCYMSKYIVHMGSDLLDGKKAQKISATNSFIHRRYNNYTDFHDIMLVKLSSPATLSPTVSKVNLSSSCKRPKTRCTLTTWSSITKEKAIYPSDFMCSNVTLIPHKDCTKFHRIVLKTFMMCAAPPYRLSFACKADSGSPLICDGTLQGLVSGGSSPCLPPFDPIIYTRVCKYSNWIYKTIKNNP